MRKKFETIFSKRKSVMKISRLKKEIAFVLALTMLVTFVPVSAMNEQESETGKKQVESGNVLEQSETSWEQKISEDVWEKIESVEDAEKIPVWIWFTDIDHQEVEKQVIKRTGLSEDMLAVDFESASEELKTVLTEATLYEGNKQQEGIVEEVLSDYMEDTEKQRAEEYERTNAYIQEKRAALSDAYVEQNGAIIEKLSISSEDIIFRSKLTPSAIVSLMKAQILEVAQDTNVQSISLYDETEYVEPIRNKSAMRVSNIYNCSGLTGKGVNVLLVDRYHVRADYPNYDKVKYPENIQVLIGEDLYETTYTSVFPSAPANEDPDNLGHGNQVVEKLQNYAKDVNVYSVQKEDLTEIEYAVENLAIHFINASSNYGTADSYKNDSNAQWFDRLVNNCNVAVIASGGNGIGWQSYGWPYVISPASGYNSIAVGAYEISEYESSQDKMKDYRYNPIEDANSIEDEKRVNYKPDVVVAAGSTSLGAPSLSGIVAMMVQLKPGLATNPQLIKAILMASCHRKVLSPDGSPNEYMSEGLTQRQGAGAVDAYRAISIVAAEQYGIGSIEEGENSIYIGKIEAGNVNVSLSWLQNPEIFEYNHTQLEEGEGAEKKTINIYTVKNPKELKLDVLTDAQLKATSSKINTGKQLTYFN